MRRSERRKAVKQSKKKRIMKWVGIIVLVLVVIAGAFALKVYNDIKSTAEGMYTPNEISDKREKAVDISNEEPFSALVLGVDERDGDKGRSDTMIVLSVNPKLKTTKMLSIPRDTYTEIIGKNKVDKINHAYAFGGIEMSRKTVENLLDIPIDFVAQVNMESFKDIIDIVGGVSINNTLNFAYGGDSFPIGELNLDGEEALNYVRMRYEDPNGDFGRQNRQKQVIQGVLKNSLSLNTVTNYKSIFKTLEDNVRINVGLDDLMDIRKNYSSSFGEIEQLYMNKGLGTKINGIYYYVPNDAEMVEIKTTLKDHLDITN